MIAPANDEAGDRVGVDGTKLVFATRPWPPLPLQPPDDRTWTFDPLDGIETVPMNLPLEISATLAEIKLSPYEETANLGYLLLRVSCR